jgi:hypothetical protein
MCIYLLVTKCNFLFRVLLCFYRSQSDCLPPYSFTCYVYGLGEGGQTSDLPALHPTDAIIRFLFIWAILNVCVHKQEGERLIKKPTVCSSAPSSPRTGDVWRNLSDEYWNLFCCYLLMVCLTTGYSDYMTSNGLVVVNTELQRIRRDWSKPRKSSYRAVSPRLRMRTSYERHNYRDSYNVSRLLGHVQGHWIVQ